MLSAPLELSRAIVERVASGNESHSTGLAATCSRYVSERWTTEPIDRRSRVIEPARRNGSSPVTRSGRPGWAEAWVIPRGSLDLKKLVKVDFPVLPHQVVRKTRGGVVVQLLCFLELLEKV